MAYHTYLLYPTIALGAPRSLDDTSLSTPILLSGLKAGSDMMQ